jgi:predicted metal-dependent enzyme (double-stranded beta helix superfamily)
VDQLLRESRRALSSPELAARAAALAVHVAPCPADTDEPAAERRYELLVADHDVEAWAIYWPPGTGVELHDHGESAGACFVVRGALVEATPDGPDIAIRSIEAGELATFPVGHVHDVTNLGDVAAASVHVYSPPLQTMTFYAVDRGAVRPTRTDRLA